MMLDIKLLSNIMNKRQELEKYSDFEAVNKKAKRLLGVGVEVSTRANKKYQIQTPDGKIVHFGLWGSEDWTKHRDPVRRKNFKTRNGEWSVSKKWTPGWLSYFLLW